MTLHERTAIASSLTIAVLCFTVALTALLTGLR